MGMSFWDAVNPFNVAGRARTLNGLDRPGAPGGKDWSNAPEDPKTAAMRARLASMKRPQALKMEEKPTTAAPLPQFQLAREQANTRFNQVGQQQNDALQRRFASMGNLNSGSAIKAEQQLQNDLNRERESTMAQINAAEMAKHDEADQARVGRNFQREMKNQDLDFQKMVFDFDSDSKLSQMDLQYKGFLADREDAEFNRWSGSEQLRKSGGLLGGGGFLGTGLGDSWLCGEADRDFPLCALEKRALGQLLRFARKADREFTRAYLREGYKVVEAIKTGDWAAWAEANSMFIRGICNRILKGDIAGAHEAYQAHFVDLVAEHWPECPHECFRVRMKEAG
jgi:hypothetical protein